MLGSALCCSPTLAQETKKTISEQLLESEHQLFLYPDSASLYLDKASICLQFNYAEKALETINRLSLEQIKDTNDLKVYYEIKTQANFALERWNEATIDWISYLNLIEETKQNPEDLVFMIMLLGNQKDTISSLSYYRLLKEKCPNMLPLNGLYAATAMYESANKPSLFERIVSGIGQAKKGFYKQAATASIFQISSIALPIWMITQGVYFTPLWLGYYLLTTSYQGNMRQIKRLSTYTEYQHRLRALDRIIRTIKS